MAIIKIRNSAIDLDAAEIPNIDASKITTGNFDASRIGSGTFADARIAASNVSQHATSFDDNDIVNDLSTIALRSATTENAVAYNTNSSFIDVFQDGSGIASHTTSGRNASEYVSSITNVADSSVVFLLNQDTESGSTTFTDASDVGHTITTGGNPTWSNAQAKWGSNSIHLDGSDWLQLADNNDWYYGDSGNGWTFEAWTYSVSSFHDGFIWYQGTDSSNGNPRNHIQLSGSTSVAFYDQAGQGGSGLSINETCPLWTENWRHLALVYDDSSNQLQFAVDGTWLGSAQSYSSPSNNSNVIKIGRGQNSSANTRYMNGYIDGLKISQKNQYTLGSNFTPPTSQFSKTTLSVNATGNFISNTITAPSSTSKMGAIITYEDASGTNALNTDIVLQLSADNGSNFTTATLTALPNYSTGIKMAKVNDLTVTAGTQLKYKISFANQSGSKEARIRGVSLQY